MLVKNGVNLAFPKIRPVVWNGPPNQLLNICRNLYWKPNFRLVVLRKSVADKSRIKNQEYIPLMRPDTEYKTNENTENTLTNYKVT